MKSISFLKWYILDNSFYIALLDMCISHDTEHQVFAQGSILWNIAPREDNTENQLFQYNHTSEDNTEINNNNS